MKTSILCAFCCALTLAARAAIVVPGADGSDGVLNITVNTEIDLSQAPTGTWDQNNAANAGKGVYDPSKWAVVFKYSSVNVASGATVTFKNHASRAPVVWLVNGNVTIAGTVSLDGENGLTGLATLGDRPREGGPGGFRGSLRRIGSGLEGSMGFGPGGGGRRGGGGYGSQGSSPDLDAGGLSYGNPSLIPLAGGSGGGSYVDHSGGGGGGAILIACANLVQCNGVIRANGGNGIGNGNNSSGPGSGGGIRVISEIIEGSGSLTALAGTQVHLSSGMGSYGRVRMERVQSTATVQISPDPSVIPLAAGATALLWPPPGAPEVKIVSLGSESTPIDPRASFGTEGADVALPQSTTVQAIVETVNVEQAAVVRVRITPRMEKNWLVTAPRVVTATLQQVVSSDPLVIHWVATLPAGDGYSAVQAHVVRP
jgi:hypothetical protein